QPGPQPGPGPRPGPKPAVQLTPEQLESTLFQIDQENKRAITAAPRNQRDQGAGSVDALFAYAEQCRLATKIVIPDKFSCLDPRAQDVPNQKIIRPARTPSKAGTRPSGLCNAPNVLNGQCDPGSHFQVLNKTQDAVVVMHCRKVALD